jgi:hypothetical protein
MRNQGVGRKMYFVVVVVGPLIWKALGTSGTCGQWRPQQQVGGAGSILLTEPEEPVATDRNNVTPTSQTLMMITIAITMIMSKWKMKIPPCGPPLGLPEFNQQVLLSSPLLSLPPS